MARKRQFTSSPEDEQSPTHHHPSTPSQANNNNNTDNSELDLSQTPTAKRARRSGRLGTTTAGSSSIPIGTPTPTSKKSKKKKKNKRVKVSHGGSDDDDDVAPESFTPGPGLLSSSSSKTSGRLSVIAPNTPYTEKIARLKRERTERKKMKGLEVGVEGVVEDCDGKSGGGDDDDDSDGDAMDVDIAVTTDDKEFVKEEQLSVKQSKKKKDAGTAGKKKKKGVSAGKGERLLTGREMMEIFPDLPKPAPDGEDEEGKEVDKEIEEQITRELKNCTGDDPPSSSSPFQSTHFDSSATTARMEIGFDEAEADDEGGEKEEIRGLIEEIFERPGFLFRGGEEEKEKVHRGEKVGGEMEMGSRDTNAPAAGKHDNAGGDLAAIKTLLQALESKMDAPCSNDGKGQQDELKDLTKELREVFNGMVKLSGRVHRDEMRAGIRHEILFDGMKKVVGELAVVKRQGEAVVEHLGLRTVSPKERRKWEEKDQNKEGRKALESCLKFHLEDMGRAREKGQLEEKGRLAVEYAGKVLGGV